MTYIDSFLVRSPRACCGGCCCRCRWTCAQRYIPQVTWTAERVSTDEFLLKEHDPVANTMQVTSLTFFTPGTESV